ncbi:MAG: hypothetical protein MK212_08210 [Saprospiraceae bacterium]|nr:hypothetical protein [Saprospiraceae bacterium]
MNVLRLVLLITFILGTYLLGYTQDKIILKDSTQITAYIQAVDTVYVYFIPVSKETGKVESDNPIQLILTDIEEIKYDYSISSSNNLSLDQKRLKDTTDFSQKAKNIFFAAVLGTTGLAGFGYERVLFKKEKIFMGLSGGVGFALNGISFPHHISFNLGKKKHCLELGLGGSYMTGKVRTTAYNLYAVYPIIGYRMQPANGFSVRAHLSPMIFIVQPDVSASITPVIPIIGASLGYAF